MNLLYHLLLFYGFLGAVVITLLKNFIICEIE